MNKLFAAALFCCLMAFSSCRTKKTTSETKSINFDVKATAQRYHAAMGSGDGVLFLVYLKSVSGIDCAKIEVDSLVVNHHRIEASLRNDSLAVVEGNYFVPKSEMGAGRPELPTVNAADPILYLEKYYPATLYIHYMDKAYTLPINEFEIITE